MYGSIRPLKINYIRMKREKFIMQHFPNGFRPSSNPVMFFLV